jgi:hypothetical protein
MDNIEEKLITYINEATIAKATLSQLKGIDLESIEIQIALCEKLNLQSTQHIELLDKNLTSGQMIGLLRDYAFTKPDVIGEIELDESILPLGIPKLLTEQTIKAKGEIWVIHKSDADPFPSTPHAHNYASGVSLDLGTGEFFKKRESRGFLDCKMLRIIREKVKGHELPALNQRCK